MKPLGKLLAVACFALVCPELPGAETNEVDFVVNYVTNGPYSASYQVGDETIRELAKAGKICRAIGHVWEPTPHVTLEYRPDGNYPVHRKCRLCGKVETKEPGAWR